MIKMLLSPHFYKAGWLDQWVGLVHVLGLYIIPYLAAVARIE